MKSYPATIDLPDAFCHRIGRIIVRYAFAEHVAQSIIHRLIGVSAKVGRVTVNAPRLPERIELIGLLAHLRKISISDTTIKSLYKDADECKFMRDLYAHGLWLRDKKKRRLLVQVTKGSKPNRPFGMSRHEWNRRVRPAGLPVELHDLESLEVDLDRLINELHVIDRGIRQYRKRPS